MARGKDKDKEQKQDQQKVEIQRDKFGLRDVMSRAANRLSDRADVLNKRGQQQLHNAQHRISRDTARFERVKAAHDQLHLPAGIEARQNAEPLDLENPAELPSDLLADVFEEPPKPKPKTTPKPPPPPGRELLASSIVPPPLPGEFELPESLTDMGLAPRSQAANRYATPIGRKVTQTSLPSTTRPNRADFMLEGDPNAPYVSFLSPGPNNVGSRIKDRISNKISSAQPENPQLSGAVPFGASFPALPISETTNLPPRAEPETPPANTPPQELVSAPIYDPNQTRGRLPSARRQILKFENPLFALLWGIVSVALLASMVFLIVFLNSSLTRSSDERFVVLFANIGEGEAYAQIPNGGGQQLARVMSGNFAQNVGLDRIEIKSSGTSPHDIKEARRLSNSNGADLLVSGYRESATGRLALRLLVSANGPYDLPQGTGHQLIARTLFDPDQLITFVTNVSDLEQGNKSDVFKLMQGIAAYYLGSYDVAERNFRELLAKKVPENEAPIRMFYANTLFLMGNYKDAESSYTTLVALNDLALKQRQTFQLNPAIVYSNRAIALYMNNNYPEANKAFEAALAIRKDLPKIHANYASFLIERTDLEYRPQLVADWKKSMEEALKLDKTIPLVYYNLGRLQDFQSDYDGAVGSFEQARKLDPNLLEAYWEEAQAYFLKFEHDNNYEHITKALEILRAGESRATILARQNRERSQAFQQSGNQTLATIWYNWAIAQENNLDKMRLGIARAFIEQTRLKGKDKGNPFDQLGRWVKNEKTPYEEATPRIQEALKNKPEDPETNFLYGQYLVITGEGDPLPYYQKAKTNERNSNKRFRYHQILAEQYQAQGKLQEALNEYADYVKFDPNRVQGYIALADAQYNLKLYKDAVASADKAIKLNANDPAAYTVAAKAQIGLQQYQPALTYLEKALLLNPNYALGYFQQGIALFNLNKKNEALVAFNKAISLEISEPQAYYYAGVIYADNQNNPKKALPLWEKAVQLNPKYAEAWARLATVYIQQNELDRAIDACEQAITAGVKEGPIYYYQGVLLESRKAEGDLAKAEQRYKQAIGFTPGLLNAHVRLAEVILAQDSKRADEALQSAQKALQLDARSPEANVALGNILRAKGDLDGAIGAYNAALNLKKELPDAYFGRSNAYLSKNQLQQALSDIDQALTFNKNWLDAYLIKGSIHISRKEFPQAQTSLEKAKALNGQDSRVYIQLGNLYEAQNQADPAINNYEQGININPKEVRFYARLGRLYLARNEVDRALEKLQKGQQLDPELKTERIAYYLGRAYMLKTRYQDAKLALERQVQLEPTFIEGRYELGNAYKTLGQNQEAIVQYSEAVKLQPAFSQAWLDLGRVYQNAGDLAKAREAYQNALKSSDPQVQNAAQVALAGLGR